VVFFNISENEVDAVIKKSLILVLSRPYIQIKRMKKIFLSYLVSCLSTSVLQAQPSPDVIGQVTIQPVMHASLALSAGGTTLFVDPVGHSDTFNAMAAPDLILITDIHGDHFSPETLQSLHLEHATLVVPQVVADKLPADLKSKAVVLHNGDEKTVKGVSITAIPMYNLPESPDSYHTKGRGNGYVLSLGGKRIYISGDTEGTPEMKALKDIDIAFVCMNLPYTMDVKQAAEAVLAFKPSVIYPYHYRGQDTQVFKSLVEAKDSAIDVRLRNWYPGQ
jgi:L-ascorbate metabolism protein UlaG (beta-lactamase superfamily)